MAIDVLSNSTNEFRLRSLESSSCNAKMKQLAKQLAESEQRYDEAPARANTERQQHETERNEIKSRIEKILARFDGIDLG